MIHKNILWVTLGMVCAHVHVRTSENEHRNACSTMSSSHFYEATSTSNAQDCSYFSSCSYSSRPTYIARLKEKSADWAMMLLFYYLRCKEYCARVCRKVKGVFFRCVSLTARSKIKG